MIKLKCIDNSKLAHILKKNNIYYASNIDKRKCKYYNIKVGYNKKEIILSLSKSRFLEI